MIQLTHVFKVYTQVGGATFPALTDVSLSIKRGEVIGIIGPSGSGKSTLMHIIGLLDKPTCGDVLFEGKTIEAYSDEELSKLRSYFVGFVFQQFNLISKLTVLENVMLPTMYARHPLPFHSRERAMELLTQCGIVNKAHSYPNKISGGEQQRAAIARALMMQPKLILADEPTGNLDTRTGKEILDLIVSLNKQKNITVVIVTHERTVVARTKRKIRLRDGKLI